MSRIVFAIATLLTMTLIFGYINSISIVFAQSEIDNSTSTEAVTSSYDAIIKAILIISQLVIAGLAFNEILYMYLKQSRITLFNNNDTSTWTSHFQVSDRYLNLIIIFSIVMAASSTTILLIQVIDLEKELGIDITTAFNIITSTSVGGVWITRIICSIVIILAAIIYYTLLFKIKKIKNKEYKLSFTKGKGQKVIKYLFPSLILFSILVSLYSNSMISHSNALSSYSKLAVFVDWIHLTAVAIWIGGLFYIYSIILKDWKVNYDGNRSKRKGISSLVRLGEINGIDRQTIAAKFIMNFSYVAILSLIIIGITGLILGRIHLQNISSLFLTVYGNILILKICLTLPMIILGKYNQDKVAHMSNLEINHENINLEENSKDIENIRNFILKKVKKSIGIELLLGIAIVTVASFLSVTSPPSLSTSNDSDAYLNVNQEPMLALSFGDGNMFTLITILLSSTIIIAGFVNLRKNARKIKITWK
ncbi:copper resistance D family protein [Candidatus Nitrosocosmicus agrestis]|uniref:copper resistance D family protein n=1 Tax=Candidatus Nitrosocosmicus agrestis TaxID=2563600 RepID=UPI0013316937|nr:CopD family protein [Candidatus Nitrosocosmicus sp. SS]MDR4489886.1 CopD family protein [Candidatus Nitrosocosmicus sp.]